VCAWAATRNFIGQQRRLCRSAAGYQAVAHDRRWERIAGCFVSQSVSRRESCSNVASVATDWRFVAMIIYNWICLLYLQYKTITILSYNLVNHNINHSLALWGTVPVLDKPSVSLNVINPTLVIGGKASQFTRGIQGLTLGGRITGLKSFVNVNRVESASVRLVPSSTSSTRQHALGPAKYGSYAFASSGQFQRLNTVTSPRCRRWAMTTL